MFMHIQMNYHVKHIFGYNLYFCVSSKLILIVIINNCWSIENLIVFGQRGS
jgi:hypothetical protein